MSETDAQVEQLRRADRRWKALAVVACWALALAAIACCCAIYRGQIEANRRLAAANRALAGLAAEAGPIPLSHRQSDQPSDDRRTKSNALTT
jgi:hypothetical protein